MKYVGKVVDISQSKVAIKAFAENDEKPTLFVMPVNDEHLRKISKNELVRFDLDEDGKCTWINIIEL